MTATPNQAQVAAVCDQLTKAQRDAIVDAADMMSSHGGYPFLTVTLTNDPWPEGVAQFLTLNTDRLTPLGIAVRAHILSGHQQ